MAINQLESASLYTDFNGLAELRRGARDNNPETIKAVAQQFEAIFVQMMMKSMRDAKLADGLFDSDQSEQYIDLHDKQLANTLSGQGKGIGLADVIARQLSGATTQTDSKIEDASNNIPPRLPTTFQLREHKHPNHGVNEQLSAVQPDRGDHVDVASTNSVKKKDDPVMNTPDDFIQELWPMAEKAAASLGVSPKAILAQAALETGWGRAVIRSQDGQNSFNLFNIKSGSGWQGDSVMKSSLEFYDGVAKQERSAFRRYNGYEESFDDYVNFLQSNPRYEKALKQGDSAASYLHELQQAGYATDPDYAEKVGAIMNRGRFASAINMVASTSETVTGTSALNKS
ncbi:MAG: flagellar assembly peptidoglycan hydrolase FlgJ [Gammaproteobacteria bacterium]|nr:flagellar assembly peptidoglycan hydrolase FlgJ [Gammaproteobacteria bacterium]